MKSNLSDIHTDDFAEILSFLEPALPVTARDDTWGSRYSNQKAHMISWFVNQSTTGSGDYNRNKGNISARAAYNKMLNPGGLLWIAEALGEDETVLHKAAKAARDAERENYRKRCCAFREVIPFDRIMTLLEFPEAWRCDPALADYLETDPESGRPHIKPGCEDAYMDALDLDI